jgi:hypothetical protein
MKFYRGLVDCISKPTKTKIIFTIIGVGSGIWFYSKFYQWKHGNHSLFGIIISTIPTIIILSLMGDVSEVEKPQIIENRKENNLPMIIDKPHRHNMYKEERKVQSMIPERIEFIECRETQDETITRIKRIYYGGNYND